MEKKVRCVDMEFDFSGNKIKIDREISVLDRFAIINMKKLKEYTEMLGAGKTAEKYLGV